jgi:hypothetical protein
MAPIINAAAQHTDDAALMGFTSMWGVPTDNGAAMFGGQDFVTRGLAAGLALPPVTASVLRRLQKGLDAGEACFPK